jgi:hypothetical protein
MNPPGWASASGRCTLRSRRAMPEAEITHGQGREALTADGLIWARNEGNGNGQAGGCLARRSSGAVLRDITEQSFLPCL